MDRSVLTSGHPRPVNRLFSITQQTVDLEEFGYLNKISLMQWDGVCHSKNLSADEI